jgi:hypothetical protein
MSRAHRFPITSLFLIAAVPLAWLACGGGESKPPETPADESSASSSSSAPPASDSASPAESASSASSDAPAASATADAPAAAPPPPSFGSTDCGTCVDKTCAKPEAACGKNSDCQAFIDAIHSCTSGAAACFDAATMPTAAKPKKLAGAYDMCVKKAAKGKACKAKCQ